MTITPNSPAKDLPIYDKAIARFPHLAYAPGALAPLLDGYMPHDSGHQVDHAHLRVRRR